MCLSPSRSIKHCRKIASLKAKPEKTLSIDEARAYSKKLIEMGNSKVIVK